MNDIGKLSQSIKTIQVLPADVDPWASTTYREAGIYFSLKSQWYHIVDGEGVNHGVAKKVFESVFIEVDPKPLTSDIDGIKEEIFLKTIALLSGRASEFKDL